MTRREKKPLAIAIGATLAVGMISPVAEAGESPFALHELSSGYRQLAATPGEAEAKDVVAKEEKKEEAEQKSGKEGKCGAGTCGGKKAAEGADAPAPAAEGDKKE